MINSYCRPAKQQLGTRNGARSATYNKEKRKYFVSIEDKHSRQLLQLPLLFPALHARRPVCHDQIVVKWV